MEINRYSEPFTPLTERVLKEDPLLLPALEQLQEVMGQESFEQYINTLAALRKSGDHLLMISRKEIYRSILMSRFLPAIKACFAVRFVRIVSQ
jgi:chromosomal replication initiation ATPase DnaA